jgi:hypothetical protein
VPVVRFTFTDFGSEEAGMTVQYRTGI